MSLELLGLRLDPRKRRGRPQLTDWEFRWLRLESAKQGGNGLHRKKRRSGIEGKGIKPKCQ